MLTPKEYLEIGIPKDNTLWLHGMDIVEHCLQKDSTQTFFKDKNDEPEFWEEWTEAMQKRASSEESFNEIYENAYNPKDTWRSYPSDSGDFQTDSYLAGEDLVFDEELRVNTPGESVSVLIDIAVPYRCRYETYMEQRHKDVYKLIAQCDSENRPLQIVACKCQKLPELDKPLNMFIVIKNYSDTIFPTIWGTITNNLCCNSFANVMMDYFIGTSHSGNGTPTDLHDIDKYFPDSEELHIYGTKLKSKYHTPKGA